jgi:peroxiredoxin
LIKFERWKEIMTPGYVDWDTRDNSSRIRKVYVETMALTGLGRLDEARGHLRELEDLVGADKGTSMVVNIAKGLLSIADNKVDEGEKCLIAADEQEKKDRKNGSFTNDPPSQAWPVARLLGDHFYKKGFYKTAVSYYESGLEREPNDGFCLSGLALSHNALNEKSAAERYAGRLKYVWANADPGLRWSDDVRRLFPTISPIGETPAKERAYHPEQLKSFGPSNWEPFSAPNLDVTNINGKRVRLSDYKGKNVLLVFFLGEACVHCVGQLKSINDKMAEFQNQDAVVLGVCSQSPKALKESLTLNPVKVTFLSDNNHENARRFASYDDFENIELHSTILIDKQGKVRWKRTGGDPFTNIDFLLGELKRINSPVVSLSQ